MLDARTLHRRAARVLPEIIQTSGLIPETTHQADLAAMLFPLRRRSSGSIIFRLSRQTRQGMGDEPLAYLRKATQARQGLGRLRKPFSYVPWRSVCIPGLGVACRWIHFTRTTDGRAWMVVVPTEGWLVYAWRD